jgi:hypothetical protein
LVSDGDKNQRVTRAETRRESGPIAPSLSPAQGALIAVKSGRAAAALSCNGLDSGGICTRFDAFASGFALHGAAAPDRSSASRHGPGANGAGCKHLREMRFHISR